MPQAITLANVKSGRGTLYNPPIKVEGTLEIGAYCAIAPNLKVIQYNHDYNYPAIQMTFYTNNFNVYMPQDASSALYDKGPVKIGNDVWIGEDVIILGGVTIKDGCCIGARSVVTKDLSPYTICAGVPCKKIKDRFPSDVVNFLLDLQWWAWPIERIKRNKAFFMLNLNTTSLNNIKQTIVA